MAYFGLGGVRCDSFGTVHLGLGGVRCGLHWFRCGKV